MVSRDGESSNFAELNTATKKSIFTGEWNSEYDLGVLSFIDCTGNEIYIQTTSSGLINAIMINKKVIFQR